MVKLTRIYTKGGDKGKTSLARGERVDKHNARVEAYGDIDETNSVIGVARSVIDRTIKNDAKRRHTDEMLARIQNDLFDLGADLATAIGKSRRGTRALRIVASQTARLEKEIDAMNGELEPLRSFVLPGGTRINAELHAARTICRRAERLLVGVAREEEVPAEAIRYLNRLSDALFVWSRWVNHVLGVPEVLWEPNRAASGKH